VHRHYVVMGSGESVDREEDTFDKAKVVVESSRSAFNSLVNVDHKMIALLLALS